MYLYDASGKSDYGGAQLKNNLFIVPSAINNYRQIMNVGTTGSNVQISDNLVARIERMASAIKMASTEATRNL